MKQMNNNSFAMKKLSLFFVLIGTALLTVALAWDPVASDCKNCNPNPYTSVLTNIFTRTGGFPNPNASCSSPNPWRVWKKEHFYYLCGNGIHVFTLFYDQGYCIDYEIGEPGSPSDACTPPPK